MNDHRNHPDESPAIELKHVSKYYDDTRVLKDISFSVGHGETKIILGGSGSGKSTILKLILGLVQADEGEIWVAGRNITRYGERPLMEIRKNIGMVFQEGALFDSLSVADNVGFRLYEQGELDDDEVLESCKTDPRIRGSARGHRQDARGAFRRHAPPNGHCPGLGGNPQNHALRTSPLPGWTPSRPEPSTSWSSS